MSSNKFDNKRFNIENRRYIGSKSKLMPWIHELIDENTVGTSFFDVFAGTGVVTSHELDAFSQFYINDFLYSNYVIFNAFFGIDFYDQNKINYYARKYALVDGIRDDDTYFVDNYGDKFFSNHDAEIIGEIRQRIANNKDLNSRERDILITSLVYSADRSANTVGHYDAYRKIKDIPNLFRFELVQPIDVSGKTIKIYRQDANELVKAVNADVVFLDPPYNSRQYSRFYHVLEEIVKWDKPKLYGVAMKPAAENMSDYSRKKAPDIFDDLVKNIHGKYIVVTYNNTYENANSSSSRNKITHKQILDSLNSVGDTKVFNHRYKSFNSGHTDLGDHREFLFITEVNNE